MAALIAEPVTPKRAHEPLNQVWHCELQLACPGSHSTYAVEVVEGYKLTLT